MKTYRLQKNGKMVESGSGGWVKYDEIPVAPDRPTFLENQKDETISTLISENARLRKALINIKNCNGAVLKYELEEMIQEALEAGQ